MIIDRSPRTCADDLRTKFPEHGLSSFAEHKDMIRKKHNFSKLVDVRWLKFAAITPHKLAERSVNGRRSSPAFVVSN
jgi:hypothetical protein